MNFSLSLAYILTLISLALAQKVAVTQVEETYTPKFMTTFTATTSSVQAGAIGLGSLSGTVGQIFSYQRTTATLLNEAPALAHSGGLGVVALLAQLLL